MTSNILYSVVDVNLIRAFVDLGFDGMSPKKRLPQNKVSLTDLSLITKI